MTNHTPTPYSVDEHLLALQAKHPNGKVYDIAALHEGWTPDGKHSARQANAAFIVRACNSHDQLIGALEYVLRLGRGTSGRLILDGFDERHIKAVLDQAKGG